MWFEPNFEARLENICKVIDKNKGEVAPRESFVAKKFKSSNISSNKSRFSSGPRDNSEKNSDKSIDRSFPFGSSSTKVNDQTPKKVQVLEVDNIFPLANQLKSPSQEE